MSKEFHQITWDDQLRDDWAQLLSLAIREDLSDDGDWTSGALVSEDAVGRAQVVARQPGILAGMPGVEMTLEAIEARLRWRPETEDGRPVAAGDLLGVIDGPARGILAAERLALNLLGHLSGIATLTRQYVEAVAGTKARIYDTRKTTPGWRRLEKYAVRCGGGRNHRSGLFDAVLIKDNHLALCAKSSAGRAARFTPAEAVARARRSIRNHGSASAGPETREMPEMREMPETCEMIVEVEVDTLQQLDEVLPAGPDIVLLDNMGPAELREAVRRRDAGHPDVELEASGGVNLQTVREIAASGVDRISIGALTHSAARLDVGLDWP